MLIKGWKGSTVLGAPFTLQAILSPVRFEIEIVGVAGDQVNVVGRCRVSLSKPDECTFNEKLKLGETRKFRINASSPEMQTWVEVKVSPRIVIVAEEEPRQSGEGILAPLP